MKIPDSFIFLLTGYVIIKGQERGYKTGWIVNNWQLDYLHQAFCSL